ncbi:host cell RNA polymerase inhibitor [Pseudomonas weihenstephanensis]|uniref:host cell RNA polymerase inhibitor n=1 Tax=Pseudomonas weihenstephanensis TaxID=1608994 RepID=UPI00193B231F|nr:host cell RNA polymerase inhibitor [Pseudomonas weihenstephanensis]MBM1189369.1 host cell RNA polymerase inhibitor [Pseudomonas weihenstephanensis]
MEHAKKAFKATVQIDDHVDEVTVYAVSLDAAWAQTETMFTQAKVTRIRPAVAPDTSRFMVTQ